MPKGEDTRYDPRRQPSRFYDYGPADTHKERQQNIEDIEAGQDELDKWAKAKGYQ